MLLSSEELQRLCFGSLKIEPREDGLHFKRFTDRQLSEWRAFDSVLGARAEATTGVTLDFYTDSSRVALEVSGGCFELLIDGASAVRMTAEELESEKNILSFTTTEGRHRVTLIFPYHSEGVLQGVALEDGASVAAPEFERRLLLLGDSITQGWNSGHDSMSYAHRTARLLNAEAVNCGIGGAIYYPPAFERIDFEPDTVICAYGTNDFGRYDSLYAFKKTVEAFFELVGNAYNGRKIVVITPIRRYDLDGAHQRDFEEHRAVIASLAGEHGFSTVDGYELVPDLESLYADSLHPNAEGMGCYAAALVQRLKAL